MKASRPSAKRPSRQAQLRPLLEWRACYGPNFPGDVSKRAAWLVELLSVKGTSAQVLTYWQSRGIRPKRIVLPPRHLVEAVRIYRKLRTDERLRLCQKFFAERAKRLDTFTVLYRHGGPLVALRQEAPSAEDAAYAVSAAVGHKCLIIAVMDARVEFFTEGGVPQIFRFWNNPNVVIEVVAWRALDRTRKISSLT